MYLNIQMYIHRNISCFLWQHRLHSTKSTSHTVNLFAIKEEQCELPQVEENRSRSCCGTSTGNHVETRRNMTCYGPFWSCLGQTELLRKKEHSHACEHHSSTISDFGPFPRQAGEQLTPAVLTGCRCSTLHKRKSAGTKVITGTGSRCNIVSMCLLCGCARVCTGGASSAKEEQFLP